MKTNDISLRLFSAMALLFVATQCVSAATITFRDELVACRGNAVTLGDIANVTPDEGESPDEIEKLKGIVLFPAPVAGKNRSITYTAVYDYLNMRGVQVDRHTFAGAPKVTVAAMTQATSSPEPMTGPTFVRRQTQSDGDERQSVAGNTATEEEENVRHAVCHFLETHVIANVPWQVDVTLSAEGKRRIAAGGGVNGIRAVTDENRAQRDASSLDPAEAWLGRQRFELQLNTISPETGMHHTMFVEVNVVLPKAVVVTRHAIAKGKVISAADVKLQYVTDVQTPSNVTRDRTVNGVTIRRNGETEIDPDVATRIEDVVGKAALRAMRGDTAVQFSLIEIPLMVKKSEVVTLFVRNGGITIKMVAKAKEEGRIGDVVTVESLSDKQTNLARVVDYGVVEIEMEDVGASLANLRSY